MLSFFKRQKEILLIFESAKSSPWASQWNLLPETRQLGGGGGGETYKEKLAEKKQIIT